MPHRVVRSAVFGDFDNVLVKNTLSLARQAQLELTSDERKQLNHWLSADPIDPAPNGDPA